MNNVLVVSFDGLFLNKDRFKTAYSFKNSIPTSVRPRDYDRTAVMRLIHECMGLPASPPVTSEDSEVDTDSPPSRSTTTSTTNVVQLPIQVSSVPLQTTLPLQQQEQQQQEHQSIPIQISPQQQDQSMFNPQLITIDERTLQLHFTPLYFGKRKTFFRSFYFEFFLLDLLDAMANIKNNNEYVQLTNTGLF